MKRAKNLALISAVVIAFAGVGTGVNSGMGATYAAMAATKEGRASVKSWTDEGLEVTLYQGGKLTVSGTGYMTEFSSVNDVPWASNYEQITYISIDQGVKSIGAYAFSGCSALTEIVIPAGLEFISENAFEYCVTLQTVYFGGLVANDWRNVLNNNNTDEALANAEIYFYRESKPSQEGNFWHYDQDGKPVIWQEKDSGNDPSGTNPGGNEKDDNGEKGDQGDEGETDADLETITILVQNILSTIARIIGLIGKMLGILLGTVTV